MKWAAIVANFFLPGLGYLIGVPEKRIAGVFWMLGAIGLSVVEQTMLDKSSTAFTAMFASVFIMNTGFAIDTWRLLKDK